MGDRVDSIPGLGKCGPVAAFNILEATTNSLEAFKAVLEAYKEVYEGDAEAQLLEQGRLLHMTRYLHEDGSPVLWEFPNV
jgi:5'-3' exonuclease